MTNKEKKKRTKKIHFCIYANHCSGNQSAFVDLIIGYSYLFSNILIFFDDICA